jgi:hypothetical protein
MSPFVAMVLTGLGAGLLIPITAIVAAKLGICDPFSLEIAGRTWTFSKNHHRVVAANTAVRFEAHMRADHAYEEHGRSSLSVSVVKLAA